MKYFVIITFFMLFVKNCSTGEQRASTYDRPDKEIRSTPSGKADTAAPPDIQAAETQPTCESQLAHVSASPHQKELGKFLSALPFIVAEAKVYPVIYLRKPACTEINTARTIRDSIRKKVRARNEIRSILDRYKTDKPFLREVFLSDGYLFEDTEEMATAMVQEIALPDLFDAPEVYRLRNNEVQRLKRIGTRYVDAEEEEATLYLNDRTDESPQRLAAPIHIDLSEVRQTTGALHILPKIVDESAAWADLVFPSGNRRPALLRMVEGKTRVSCIGGDPTGLSKELEQAKIFWERHRKVQVAAKHLTVERPLFDEPTDEEDDVQEDGKLRLAWKDAYFGRKKKFSYREVVYDVFDKKGNPVPPQVCVDFILDTWERAAGTWYNKRNLPPQRTIGDIDFNAIENFSRRYIASILTFASLEKTPFERYDFPRRNWVPLKSRRRFVKNLLKFSDKFREGDLLVIHGLRDEDEQEHFHTVLILSTDPITGIPTEVADNQGRPRISTLRSAMRAAPRRSIKYRLRLDFEQMKDLTAQSRDLKALPASIP